MLAVAARRTTARLAAPSSRSFWNISLPVLGGPGGAHVTKYQIVRPNKDGVEWDDFLLQLPERDQLASFTKEVPLFVRYLKTVTDKEGRSDAFDGFCDRAKNGLVVESDVFITTEELTALMWKNGYSEEERNAVQSTFPADYKFHYPELSVMFELAEEDTYKFCMRTRIEASHIGELDSEKVKRKGYIRDHWLVFGVGISTFKFFPFFNYYFGIKVFGTGMWCYTMWSLLNRMISRACRRNEYMAAQKTAADVMEGEDAIVASMQRFANDAKCVEYLKDFKAETEDKIGAYRRALALKMKDDLTERATKQLQAVAAFEAGMGSALQDLVVREAGASFREAFPQNKGMQDKAFSAALKNLAGEQVAAGDDPVAVHFETAFKSLSTVDLMKVKGDARGSLPERVAYAQQAKETEFKQTFMVTKEEAGEVQKIASQARSGDGFDFSKLSEDAAARLDELYTSINNKVGYALPASLGTTPVAATSDAAANSYVTQVNEKLAAAEAALREARLKSFVQAFA